MAVFLQPIYTQTVGAGGAASITFNNIPQTFTDLKVVISSRSDTTVPSIYFQFSGDGSSNYSNTTLRGDGSSASSIRLSSSTFIRFDSTSDGTGATSNTFGNAEIYIPNYTSSNYKQFTYDAVAETNSATMSYVNSLGAGLWRNTSPITSVLVDIDSNFVQYSTVSLYGILRSGV